MALCIDPHSEGASGIGATALRALGLDTGELSEKEKAHRDQLRAKIRSEFIPYADVAQSPGKIPGLGPPDDQPAQWALAIPLGRIVNNLRKDRPRLRVQAEKQVHRAALPPAYVRLRIRCRP